MKRKLALLYAWGCLAATAQTTTLHVSNEIVPAGGLAQMKLQLSSPKPIVSGNMYMDMSGVSYDSIDGIALFSGTGDVVGAATLYGGKVNVQFTSPGGTFGGDTNYPLMTIALTASKYALPGQTFPVILDPNASFWQSLLGATTFDIKQGSITINSGGVNISNVVPGGGILPPGATLSIFGSNFNPQTKISFHGYSTQSIEYISPNEMRVTTKDGGMLDGVLIQAQNSDKSTDTYYSYLRGVSVGQSTRPLLASTVPVFSILTATEAVLPPTISSQLNPAYFTGIALQNSSFSTAAIVVESHDSSGALTGSTSLSLASGARISREVSELLGTTLPTGSYLHILSNVPVQME
jgi:hypothetical protein